MPCKEYERLAAIEKYERQQHNYFAFNKTLARVSERKGSQLAREAMKKAAEARNKMFEHQRYCETCKNESPERSSGGR